MGRNKRRNFEKFETFALLLFFCYSLAAISIDIHFDQSTESYFFTILLGYFLQDWKNQLTRIRLEGWQFMSMTFFFIIIYIGIFRTWILCDMNVYVCVCECVVWCSCVPRMNLNKWLIFIISLLYEKKKWHSIYIFKRVGCLWGV